MLIPTQNGHKSLYLTASTWKHVEPEHPSFFFFFLNIAEWVTDLGKSEGGRAVYVNQSVFLCFLCDLPALIQHLSLAGAGRLKRWPELQSSV